jgi:hypothetical protein
MPDTPLTDIRELWRDQTSDLFRLSTEEIPKRIARFERRSRRAIFDGYLAAAFIMCSFLCISLLFENPLMRIGSALTITAFGLVAWNTRAAQLEERSAAQRAAEGGTSALDFHRGQLERSRDRHQGPRWWAQWLALIPGGLLFFAGFAQALPKLTVIIAFEALTFVIGIASAVPLNRRAARNCQQQLDALDRLKE